MINRKNHLMLWIAFGSVLLSVAAHLLGRNTTLFDHDGMMSMHDVEVTQSYLIGLNVLFVLPIALWLLAFLRCLVSKYEHRRIPVYLALAQTFSSISIIAGSGGGVEFHFSIFMVIAAIAYYDSIRLVAVATGIFAVQHFAGFFLFRELVFGFMPTSFTMLLIHAIFLVMTAAATATQIYSKRKITDALEADKQQKDAKLLTLLSSAQHLSSELDQSSELVSEKSSGMVLMNEQMNISFKEVSVGLESQSESIQHIESDLHGINERIIGTSELSDEISRRASYSGEYVNRSDQNITELFNQILVLSNSVQAVQETIEKLNQSSLQIEDIIATVQQVADQTGMLALNAAIEAARAGEAGNGFSVVATEIRKLADRSKESTAEIQAILLSIKEESQTSAMQVAAGKQATDSSVHKAEETIQGFSSMRDDLNEMIHLITRLNDAIIEIKAGSASIAGEIGNISSITEQNVAAVEQLIASSEEQVSAYSTVDQEVQHLKRLSQTLNDSFAS